MTLHIVLGDGYMPVKELTAQLQDLREQALADDDAFWFMLAAKAEPTDTDRAIIKWLNEEDHDIYWDAIGDKESADKIYSTAQTVHKTSKLATTVVKLMQQANSGGVDEDEEVIEPEGADLLALYFSDEPDADEDRWLNDAISAVADAGFPVYALNDGMTLVEPDTDEAPEDAAEDEIEDEAKPPPPKLSIVAPLQHTRDELLEMDLDELKKIALEKGIEVAPRSRRGTYVDAILGEDEEVPEVELDVAEPHTVQEFTTTVNTTNGVASVTGASISGPTMIIIVHDGIVTTKLVTASEAQALLSS